LQNTSVSHIFAEKSGINARTILVCQSLSGQGKRTPSKYSFHPIDKRIFIEYFYGVFIGSKSDETAATILTRQERL